jgi:flagellar motor switch/type III secretory pathway protein FliN
MNTEATDARASFSADLVRSKGVNLTHQLELLSPVADSLAEHAGAILSELGHFPVKVTLEEAKDAKLPPLSQAEAGFDIVSATETVWCWNKADPEFDNMVSELCLGGVGTVGGGTDAQRPSTNFDKRLRSLIDEKIATAAARALSEVGELPGLTVRPRARMAARKAEGLRLCYSARLLLSVFNESCEYTVFLSFAECVGLIGGSRGLTATSPPSAAGLVERTPFSIEVYLKPDVLDVRQVLNLVPGEVLKLNVSASTPVDLRLNGKTLSQGMLSYDNNCGRIKLLDGVPIVGLSGAQDNSTSPAGQHGN